MNQADLDRLTKLIEALGQILDTGHTDEGGWFACWHAEHPNAAADFFRHRVSGCRTEPEVVATFLSRERDRLDKLEVVADLVRQLQALAADPAHRNITKDVWQELVERVAALDATDRPPGD